jgi:hypothetical protein
MTGRDPDRPNRRCRMALAGVVVFRAELSVERQEKKCRDPAKCHPEQKE